MDKKTLRRIIENLKRDKLLDTRDFKVSIKPTRGEEQLVIKTVLLAPFCTKSDSEIMLECEAIANPTGKKKEEEVVAPRVTRS